MPLLQPLGQGQGFLKAGFLGFSKSGKTFTATDLAIGCFKFFGNSNDIVFFDSEGGSEYVSARIQATIGKPAVGLKARSFSDLMAVASEVKANDVFIVDSITHPWRELCDSYLAQVNVGLKKRNMKPRLKLEFQDWGPIKMAWAKWADWYLNSPVHVIICGRAGYEYAMEMNEETEKRELIKTGTKMKTESEFGFEPSLLVEMERIPNPGGLRRAIQRQATVIGDRFGILDGKTFVNPKWKDFEPHVRLLKPGVHSPIDVDSKTDLGIDDSGDAEYNRERKTRTILIEEVQGVFQNYVAGQSVDEKMRRAELLQTAFGTRAPTALTNIPIEKLREGLAYLRQHFGEHPTAAHETPPVEEAEGVPA